MKRLVFCRTLALIAGIVLGAHEGALAEPLECPGDCGANGAVTIDEVVRCTSIALGNLPLAECRACDVDGDGRVTVNEVIAAVGAALCGCPGCPTPTPTPSHTATATATATSTATRSNTATATPGGYCGDGEVNVPGEECDDGNTFGGDGCAANCTVEHARVGEFDTPRTAVVVQGQAVPVATNLTGSQVFRTGSPRDSRVFGRDGRLLFEPGEMPVAVRAEDVRFEPVALIGVNCACVRAVPVPSYGPGISAVGVIACGDQGLTDVDYRLVQDHNTNPGDPCNQSVGQPDDAACEATAMLPGGVVSEACREGSGDRCRDRENEHIGVCNSPRFLTRFGGRVPRGSAFILNSTAIGLLKDAGACDDKATPGRPCLYPDYGPDCLPCTDDDFEQGDPENLPTTTGTAEAILYDANNNTPTSCRSAGIIEHGQSCFGIPCVARVTGSPFDCDLLAAQPDGGLAGGSLAVAFPGLDATSIGDTVTTTVFFHK